MPLRAEVLHVDVGSQANVVGKVPANVIRIIVEDDLIGGPIPVAAVADVIGRYAEVESAEPEAARTASAETPDVSAANLTGKVSVLPGMVEMIVRIVRPVSWPTHWSLACTCGASGWPGWSLKSDGSGCLRLSRGAGAGMRTPVPGRARGYGRLQLHDQQPARLLALHAPSWLLLGKSGNGTDQ